MLSNMLNDLAEAMKAVGREKKHYGLQKTNHFNTGVSAWLIKAANVL